MVDCNGLMVGLMRGDGEREGKIWEENGLGKKIDIEWAEMGFQIRHFFFF